MIVTIKDETAAGKVLNEVELTFKEDWVTVKEIITERVSQEVENYNRKAGQNFNGLIVPEGAEPTINGFHLKPGKFIDPEKQVYTALDSFQKNGFFVLIDNIQSEKLDQRVKLSDQTKISFVKLTPLIGG